MSGTPRARLFALHSWLGLAFGIVWLAIAWSGAVAVFRDEIDWLVTPALRASGPPGRIRVERIRRVVERTHPGSAVDSLIAPAAPGFNWTATATLRRRVTAQVFVDAATMRVTGTRRSDEYSASLSNLIRQIHVRLLMGVWGRLFVGACGAALGITSLIALWLVRDRIRTALRFRPRAGRRARWTDVHKFVGLWAVPWMLFMATSGAVLGLEGLSPLVRQWNARRQARLHPSAPPRQESREAPPAANQTAPSPNAGTPPALAAPPNDAPMALDIDMAIAVARRALPGHSVNTILLPMEEPGSNYRVVMDARSMWIRREGSHVDVDPDTGRVVAVSDARRGRTLSRLYDTLDPLHFGYWGSRWGRVANWSVRVLWAVFGLLPGLLAITGSLMRIRRPAPQPIARRVRVSRLLAIALWCSGFVVPFAASAVMFTRNSPKALALGVGEFVEQLIAKPLTLALVALPVTAGGVFLSRWILRTRKSHRGSVIAWLAIGLGFGAWQWALSTMFIG